MKNLFYNFDIHQYAENALLISWAVNRPEHEFVNYRQKFISFLKKEDKDIKYLTPAFDALLIAFHTKIDMKSKLYKTHEHLKSFLNNDITTPKKEIFNIPVCYEDFGLDLESIARHSGLSVPDIINIHSEKVYTLYFIGFLPGFLYMGNVDERIRIPRQQSPRPKVEQGSIGIAELQTGIYPSSSPGGWQIVGRTPVKIFDASENPPCPFAPGDQIRFKSISKTEFDEISNANSKIIKKV
jgi:inhibitor of KinA